MKVIKHFDYGLSVESMPNDNGEVEMKMYISVYELNNGKKISLQSIKYYNKKKSIYEWGDFSDGDEYHTCYIEHYNFGDEFYDWFYKMPKWTAESIFPSNKEQRIIGSFYEKNIKPFNNE